MAVYNHTPGPACSCQPASTFAHLGEPLNCARHGGEREGPHTQGFDLLTPVSDPGGSLHWKCHSPTL